MGRRMHHLWLPAAIALLLSGGSLAAAEQKPADQDIGAEYSEPEWQVFDKLDDRYGALAWLTFGQVIGAQVVNKQGEPVGEIVHLVRAKDDGMFYAVIDAAASYGEGDRVVSVDELEVVGDSEQDRQIVLAGEDAGDFDEAQFEPAPPPEQGG